MSKTVTSILEDFHASVEKQVKELGKKQNIQIIGMSDARGSEFSLLGEPRGSLVTYELTIDGSQGQGYEIADGDGRFISGIDLFGNTTPKSIAKRVFKAILSELAKRQGKTASVPSKYLK